VLKYSYKKPPKFRFYLEYRDVIMLKQQIVDELHFRRTRYINLLENNELYKLDGV